ncbi:hypothetical protein BDV39DRAFT_78046 [Aspergillus sergii]|uniref:Uncharacterized protein n=1 Tax=Aspergillus sergii TaxID=1034303 RepID=A0A5N6X814_9EURO|nr:hypothetical protein BDV39DRAFT_78046 [Aspergillus sergii]
MWLSWTNLLAINHRFLAIGWRHPLRIVLTNVLVFDRPGFGVRELAAGALPQDPFPVAKLLHGRHEIKSDALGSFLLVLIAGYYRPHFGNFFPKIVAMRQCFHAIWQLFPITVQAPFRLLEKCAYPPVRPRPQQREEAKRHSTKNLRYIRSMHPALGLVFGLTFIHTRLSVPEVHL